MTDTFTQWDQTAELYDENMGEQGDDLNRGIIRPALLAMLGDLRGKSVLDSGCGSGYVAAELANTAEHVIGTDFAHSFIRLCKKKYAGVTNLGFQIHDVKETMPFTAGQFNAVLSKMVLQFVPDFTLFAAESYRVLSRQGVLAVIIDHPFHTQFFYAQSVAGSPNPKYPDLNHYFDQAARMKLSLWGKAQLTWYPRTVSVYVNTFLESGFTLRHIGELAEQESGWNIPRILTLEFVKL